MIAPSTLPDNLRHFTNRETALAAFDALWPGDGAWVLAFDGLSGNGKSTLIDFLIETRCKPRALAYAILDFESGLGLNVRAELRPDWEPLLDALAAQWQLAGRPAYAAARNQARQRYQAVARPLQITIQQQADRQGQIQASPISIDAGQSEALRQASQQARADTAAALLEAAAAVYAGQPLALFMDTYEKMAEGSDKEYGNWRWGWLTNAAARLPGLRVIVGSRQPLTGLKARLAAKGAGGLSMSFRAAGGEKSPYEAAYIAARRLDKISRRCASRNDMMGEANDNESVLCLHYVQFQGHALCWDDFQPATARLRT